jgi:hypothetical protein
MSRLAARRAGRRAARTPAAAPAVLAGGQRRDEVECLEDEAIWHTAREIPGTAALNEGGNAQGVC